MAFDRLRQSLCHVFIKWRLEDIILMVFIHGSALEWENYFFTVDGKQIDDWVCADTERGILVARTWRISGGEVTQDNLDVYRGKVEIHKIKEK